MLPALSESYALRLVAFSAFYFAEGIPSGLLNLALPTWLMNTLSIEAVASFKAVVFLPWSFKPIVGPLMDSCTCLSFGFRRPWVVAWMSALVMCLGVMSAGFSANAEAAVSIPLLSTLGFLVNMCSASMDVAIDGMAIFLLRPDELGRANSLMAAGQVVGSSTMGAASGRLLNVFGVRGAAGASAGVLLPILALIILVLEQPGERRVPCGHLSAQHHLASPSSKAAAGARAEPEAAAPSLTMIAVSLLHGLCLNPSSVLIIIAMLLDGSSTGAGDLIWTAAFLDAGISSARYTEFASAAGLLWAIVAIPVGGLSDRFGIKPFFIGALCVNGAALVIVALLAPRQPLVLYALRFAIIGCQQVTFIGNLTFCMSICSTSLAAATHFSIMMASANFAKVIGDMMIASALLSSQSSWFGMFAVQKLLAVVAVAFLVSPTSSDTSSRSDSRSRSSGGEQLM